jgi:tRNA(Met) C34 N-acetyltransferase TmcA
MLTAIKDASNLTVISNTTKKPVLFADYCNSTDISFKADTVYAMNKGTKAVRWDKNKEGTFKTEMEVFELKWISLLLGTNFTTGVASLSKREVLPVTGGVATLVGTPKVGSLVIFKVDPYDKHTHLNEQTVGTVSTADKYAITGQNITLNTTTTFTDNAGFIVCYYLVDSLASAQTLSVKISEFPGNFNIYGDTMIRNTDGTDSIIQFNIPNCKPKLSMDLSFNADNVTKLSVEWDMFADGNGNMFTFTIL